MKLTVKTLKGGKFQVEVEESNTVEQVKGIIATAKPELPAASQKLIHSGKVLKDDNVISSCGIKPNDFLVVMVTKAKKEAAPAPAAATPKTEATATAAAATPAPAAAAAATAPAAPAASTTTATTTTPAPPTSSAPAAPPAAPEQQTQVSDEAVANLTAMGFPEAEVRHCLRAAHGNPDIAVEFLTNGIPDGVAQAASMVQASSSSSPAAGGAAPSGGGADAARPLQALRNHPQFNDLRRLVQSNPQMLQQVLAQIGQQQPELLQEINANQALFLEMMNEPITAAETSNTTGGSSSGGAAAGAGAAGGGMPMGLEGLGNPAQMAQMIQSMSPAELQQMAQMMGLSPDQLRMTAQMLGQMPPEQLQQFMMQAMGANGGAGMPPPGMMGGGGGGPQVLRLTEEEMAAVDRLTEMGFDRSEAAQAFLACDKNEALAANLLMDSMGEGGFFGGGGGGSGSGGGSGGNDNSGGGSGSNDNNNNSGGSGNDGGGTGSGGNDGDDMYD